MISLVGLWADGWMGETSGGVGVLVTPQKSINVFEIF